MIVEVLSKVCWLMCVGVLQELEVTDDTVLEQHTEDPTTVYICLVSKEGQYFCCLYTYTYMYMYILQHHNTACRGEVLAT